MSYPAFAAFFEDPERTTARICVYMALQPPFLSLNPITPRDVKLEVVARSARVHHGTAAKALAWLIKRGYVVVHARGHRGMPSVTLAYDLPHNVSAATVHSNADTRGPHT